MDHHIDEDVGLHCLDANEVMQEFHKRRQLKHPECPLDVIVIHGLDLRGPLVQMFILKYLMQHKNTVKRGKMLRRVLTCRK